MRDHLEQVGKTTGKYDKRLSHEAPPLFIYLWNIFIDLRNESVVTYAEIKAWCELLNMKLSPSEVTIIKKLDRMSHDN